MLRQSNTSMDSPIACGLDPSPCIVRGTSSVGLARSIFHFFSLTDRLDIPSGVRASTPFQLIVFPPTPMSSRASSHFHSKFMLWRTFRTALGRAVKDEGHVALDVEQHVCQCWARLFSAGHGRHHSILDFNVAVSSLRGGRHWWKRVEACPRELSVWSSVDVSCACHCCRAGRGTLSHWGMMGLRGRLVCSSCEMWSRGRVSTNEIFSTLTLKIARILAHAKACSAAV